MSAEEMEAGRELDALVWLALNSKAGKMTDQGILGCRYVDGDIQPHAGYPVGHISPPNYSTDIAAAWEVVDHFMKKQMVILLDNDRHEHIFGPWRCTFVHEDFVDYWWDAGWTECATTPQLAICHAALKVIQ